MNSKEAIKELEQKGKTSSPCRRGAALGEKTQRRAAMGSVTICDEARSDPTETTASEDSSFVATEAETTPTDKLPCLTNQTRKASVETRAKTPGPASAENGGQPPPPPCVIQDWHAVLGDKHSGLKDRTTTATRILKEVKFEFREAHANKKGSTWFRAAYQEYQRRVKLHFAAQKTEANDIGLVLIQRSPKVLESKRVEAGGILYAYPSSSKQNNNANKEASYGLAKVPEAIDFFFHSRDPPTLEYETKRFRRYLTALYKSKEQPPASMTEVFDDLLTFVERNLARAQQNDDDDKHEMASQLLEQDTKFIPVLQRQWKFLIKHKRPVMKAQQQRKELMEEPLLGHAAEEEPIEPLPTGNDSGEEDLDFEVEMLACLRRVFQDDDTGNDQGEKDGDSIKHLIDTALQVLESATVATEAVSCLTETGNRDVEAVVGDSQQERQRSGGDFPDTRTGDTKKPKRIPRGVCGWKNCRVYQKAFRDHPPLVPNETAKSMFYRIKDVPEFLNKHRLLGADILSTASHGEDAGAAMETTCADSRSKHAIASSTDTTNQGCDPIQDKEALRKLEPMGTQNGSLDRMMEKIQLDNHSTHTERRSGSVEDQNNNSIHSHGDDGKITDLHSRDDPSVTNSQVSASGRKRGRRTSRNNSERTRRRSLSSASKKSRGSNQNVPLEIEFNNKVSEDAYDDDDDDVDSYESYDSAELRASKAGNSVSEPNHVDDKSETSRQGRGCEKQSSAESKHGRVQRHGSRSSLGNSSQRSEERRSVRNVRYVTDVEVTDRYGEQGKYTGAIFGHTHMPHGFGRLDFDKEGRFYQGEWKHGRMTGQGHISNGDGEYYIGGLKNNLKHGRGFTRFASGRQFEGEYTSGEMVRGKMTYTDGTTYSGRWVDGNKHGWGVMRFADNSIYEGEFMEGHFYGHGKLIWNDAGWYEEEWRSCRHEVSVVSPSESKEIQPSTSRNVDQSPSKCLGNK